MGGRDGGQRTYATPVLVTTDWLAEHLTTIRVVVAEVDENPDLYDEGHIPGAVKLHWKDDLQDPIERDLVDKESFERLLGELGIGNDTTVVLYGDKNNWFAAYAYWYLKIYGHEDVRILDGGRQKWIDEGRELTTDVPSPRRPRRTRRRSATSRSASTATRCWPARRRGDRARRRPQPAGVRGRADAPPGYEQEGARSAAGHIPTAQSIPWATAVRDDGTFKAADELRGDLRGKGVTPDKEVRAYCRIGERCAHLVRAPRAARLRERQELRRLVDRVGEPRRRADREGRLRPRLDLVADPLDDDARRGRASG